MAFTKATRVWWDTSKPGSGTALLSDADVAGTPAQDDDSGTTSLHRGQLIICARSGFAVPERETVVDPYTGRLIWRHFVDHLHELDKAKGRP